MRAQVLALAGGLAVVIAIVFLGTALVAGQAPATAARTTAAAKPVATPKPAEPRKGGWTPPRTPWGDPDIQGNLTNLYEVGTPFERPETFAGRKLEDVKGEELAKIRRTIQEQTRSQELAGEIGGTRWIWLDSFDHARGSSAWFVVDPPDGKIPPGTPEAQRRAAARAEARRANGRGPADSWEDRSLYDRCITRGLPGSMMPAVYGNSYQIVQGPGYVAIRYEMVHETRVIPLDGRPHVGKDIRLDMGDARGHWEGDTLIVETTNFRDRSAYRGSNAATLKLIERFRRVAPDKVNWAVTIDDPTTWVRPWTFSMPLTINNNEQLMPYECHEGNYAMTNILSGARGEEKAVEEDAKKGIVRAPRAIPTGAEAER